MAYQQPAQAYQNNSVNTASPADLTLMLYNGALKFIKLTKMEIAEKRYNTAHEYNIRVQDIIRELMLTLDHQYPVAEQMNRLYEYLHKRLIEANVKKDTTILDEVEDFIAQFRDAWKQAVVLAKKQGHAL
ncbi:flagellar export chaperone FliS [Brevibacillus borstelensis]|uniref:flagellar export chaperone FliS n=1 Tax=Brevibacillus borstelensis TaxID=45462 RepID=UPI001562B2FE|nr:flagellar export chaperone FliS [Brevibacillus borstelensis]MBE5396802.1 flagellar export chaperone FliS [Brevibacillus borstelensis]